MEQLVTEVLAQDDEIIILDDHSDDELTVSILQHWMQFEFVTPNQRKFEGDFAEHKNYLNSLCAGEWILQIDADELLSNGLARRLHALVESNPHADLIFIPRVNTVEGLTQEDIRRFGWNVNDQGWVMWPDYQGRLYRNQPNIYWQGKVHERIVGMKTWSFLPEDSDWAIIHAKDIERQRKQNELYASLV